MINPKVFIQRVKGFIAENPKRAKFIGLLILAAALPLVVAAALTVQNLIQKASEQNVVVRISDAGGNTLSSTSDRNVFIDINLNAATGWVLSNQQSSNSTNGLVDNAYAQEEETTSVCDQYQNKTSCLSDSRCGWGVIGGIGVCSTTPPNPTKPANCGSIYDEWYYGDPNTNRCVNTIYQTPQSLPTSIVTPTTVPISKNALYSQCLEDCSSAGGVSCEKSCASILSYPTPQSFVPTSTPRATLSSSPTATPTPNILKFVYIENKDTDGSTGGSEPVKIAVNSGADVAHIAWKLNDLLPGQDQAPRTAQVTLIGDNITVPFITRINLVRPNGPTNILSRVDVSFDCASQSPFPIQVQVGRECHGSALAYDTSNSPMYKDVTYSWGISSTNSIGTLSKTSGNITSFYAQNIGTGDIWVIAQQGNTQIRKGLTAQVIAPTINPINPQKNPVSWKTNHVSLQADDFYIEIGGRKYFGNTGNIQIHSDPPDSGNPNYTTLEIIWTEKTDGTEMRVFMYFDYVSPFWKLFELRTYNGQKPGDWIMYKPSDKFNQPIQNFLGQTYTLSSIEFTSLPDNKYKGLIHFDNLKLQAFLNKSSTANVNYDLNNDSIVNCKDVAILISQYGQKGSLLSADLNRDGIVDGIDYNMLVKNYTPGDTTKCE